MVVSPDILSRTTRYFSAANSPFRCTVTFKIAPETFQSADVISFTLASTFVHHDRRDYGNLPGGEVARALIIIALNARKTRTEKRGIEQASGITGHTLILSENNHRLCS